VADAIEFDWDEQNRSHLKRHRASPQEFEQAMMNDPIHLEYQVENGEARYKALGISNTGRELIAVWTLRKERVRAVTPYPAGSAYAKAYWEMKR